ncbi:MAG TPA: hypothetical protein VK081_09080 [Planctomycetota bacterium]|nr:hypothetical protein [Planctomycetota bacterium]
MTRRVDEATAGAAGCACSHPPAQITRRRLRGARRTPPAHGRPDVGTALDALVFSAGPAAVRDVFVAGFKRAMRKLAAAE